MKEKLTIIKVGGKIVEDETSLTALLRDFKAVEGNKILVHGGGRTATDIAARLGIETRMVEGRRITDKSMLKVVTMVYAGLVNKNIVAKLNAMGVCALGITGADCNVMLSHRRAAGKVDYGFVGDVDKVDAERLSGLVNAGVTPVLAPLTHDGNGTLLNTNADTIAGETAKAMAALYDVTLVYCFEKKGVLRNADDNDSVIPVIRRDYFKGLVEENIVNGGMIPKIENALAATDCGVSRVVITSAQALDIEKGTQILP